ncbi:hypothetical protein LCGC14_1571830, partial [marine sediment metagenome]
RDLPDWGGLPAPLTVHEVTDLGELAARLGSVVTYHRGGVVIFVEDFADGMNRWDTVLGGAGDVADLSLVRSLSGLLSARLLAASAAAPYAQIWHKLPVQIASRAGCEIAFAMDGVTSEVDLQIARYDGSNLVLGRVFYDAVNERLRYRDSADVAVTLATGVALSTVAGVFHYMKLVVDLESDEYVKVLLDNVAYSLTGVALRTQASATAPGFAILALNRGVAGESHAVYLDRVIITQNEPL